MSRINSNQIGIGVLAVGCLILAGCAQSVFVPTMAMEKQLNDYATVYFTSTSHTAEDITQELIIFEEETVKKIEKLKLFTDIWQGHCNANCGRTLQVQATVTSIKKVSGGARFFLGMFAGEASLEATMYVTDASNTDTLGVYEVKGTSGSTGFSGTTKSALQKAGQAIANILKENFTSVAPGAITQTP